MTIIMIIMVMMVVMVMWLPWWKTTQVDEAIDGEVAQGGVAARAGGNNDDTMIVCLFLDNDEENENTWSSPGEGYPQQGWLSTQGPSLQPESMMIVMTMKSNERNPWKRFNKSSWRIIMKVFMFRRLPWNCNRTIKIDIESDFAGEIGGKYRNKYLLKQICFDINFPIMLFWL